MGRLERDFQPKLIRRLQNEFPDCVIVKNDARYIQGIPDLTIFFKNRWAMLECKREGKSSHQPNQDYWVEHMNEMSFARFVNPDNVEEVIYDLQRSFES